MKLLKTFTTVAVLFGTSAVPALATSIGVGISGPGAVNDSTIKAGEPVSVDVYITNDTTYTGFSLGFKLLSDGIKNVVHVTDSGNGLNDRGDVKGYNGWESKAIWDFGGVFVVERDWDGALPDTLGFGGLCIKQRYNAHERHKVLSFDIVVPDPGRLQVDSSFFPPGGRWLFSAPPPGPAREPKWEGPYIYQVVE